MVLFLMILLFRQLFYLILFRKKGSIKVWDFGAGQELKHMQETILNEEGSTNQNISIIDIYYVKIKEDLFIAVFDKENKIKMFLVK